MEAVLPPPSCTPRGSAILIPAIMSTEQNPPTIDARVLETAVNVQVFNSEGGLLRFGEIFADQKTIVVFIRASTNSACSHMFSFDSFVCPKGIFSVG
jgi:hypothetical protein